MIITILQFFFPALSKEYGDWMVSKLGIGIGLQEQVNGRSQHGDEVQRLNLVRSGDPQVLRIGLVLARIG